MTPMTWDCADAHAPGNELDSPRKREACPGVAARLAKAFRPVRDNEARTTLTATAKASSRPTANMSDQQGA